MFKNTAGQKIEFLAINTVLNIPQLGDAANLTAFRSPDDQVPFVPLLDVTATELDPAAAPGIYSFDLNISEVNCDKEIFTALSSSPDVELVPVIVYLIPATTFTPGTLVPSTVPNSTTGYATIYDNLGALAVGIIVTCVPVTPPTINPGFVFGAFPRSVVSDINGIVQFPNLVKGMEYDFMPERAAGSTRTLIDKAAGVSVALPNMLN